MEEQKGTKLTSEQVEQLVEIGNHFIDAATAKPTLREKLRSRKFWLCVALMVVGICGMIGFSNDTTAIIVFAILEIVSVLGYCFTEGYIDASRAKGVLSSVETIGIMLGNSTVAQEESQKAIKEYEKTQDQEVIIPEEDRKPDDESGE